MSQENGKTATRERSEVPQQPRTQPGSQQGTKRADVASQSPDQGKDQGKDSGPLVTSTGRTTIADAVVAKIVGMAAREVGGVYAMGDGMGRTIGSVREHIPGMGKNLSQGVSVEVGERQAAVDIDLVVEYGVAIPALAGAVRENVIRSVEHMCGLEVVEVNITIDDIHLPGEENDSDQDRDPRVQ